MSRHVFEHVETEKPAPRGPRAFVTGWPVWHSRSPLIHGAWLEQHGMEGSYERVGVPPEEIGEFLEGLAANGYVGGNVTIPHKEAVFAAVERRDPAASAIGAVNTLWFEDGVLTGGNTDAYGFAANLDERLAGWADAESAVVLGAGGAARAVIYALLERGIRHVSVVNRTVERAEALAAAFTAHGVVTAHGEDAREGVLASADLLVNTVPIPALTAEEERYGFVPPLPDLSMLQDHALVTDIVYVPIETPTILAARKRGLRAADGLGMLLHQAVPGFERWFGLRPTVDETLRARIERDVARAG